jgi:hypothetical protein
MADADEARRWRLVAEFLEDYRHEPPEVRPALTCTAPTKSSLRSAQSSRTRNRRNGCAYCWTTFFPNTADGNGSEEAILRPAITLVVTLVCLRVGPRLLKY